MRVANLRNRRQWHERPCWFEARGRFETQGRFETKGRFESQCRHPHALMSALVSAILLLMASPTMAESIVRNDAAHSQVEIEPHGVIGVFLPPGDGGVFGLGAGVRAGIPVAPSGFIEGINDSVAIGFGLDWGYYFGQGPSSGSCAEYRGTGNRRICVRVAGASGPAHYFYVPAVMQWNFYLTDDWSVFGEPGFGLYFQSRELDGSLGVGPLPIFQAGARYHFSDAFTLTLRTGYPYTSVGVSLLF